MPVQRGWGCGGCDGTPFSGIVLCFCVLFLVLWIFPGIAPPLLRRIKPSTPLSGKDLFFFACQRTCGRQRLNPAGEDPLLLLLLLVRVYRGHPINSLFLESHPPFQKPSYGPGIPYGDWFPGSTPNVHTFPN